MSIATEYFLPEGRAIFRNIPVISILNTPPDPKEGDCHIIGAAPEGAWLGKTDQLALYWGSEWKYEVPGNPTIVFLVSESKLYLYTTSWREY
jgi:hypothetical protein